MFNKNQPDTTVGLPPWNFDHSPWIFALPPTGKFPKQTTFHGTKQSLQTLLQLDRATGKISEQQKVPIKLTRELHACARASCRYDVGNSTRSLAQLVNPCKLFLRFKAFEYI